MSNRSFVSAACWIHLGDLSMAYLHGTSTNNRFCEYQGHLGDADTLWVSTAVNSLYFSGVCHHDELLDSSWLYGICWNILDVQYDISYTEWMNLTSKGGEEIWTFRALALHLVLV